MHLLGHTQGGLKGRPAGARVVPLLNKLTADSEQRMQVSARLAQRLLQQTAGISEVIFGRRRHTGARGAGNWPRRRRYLGPRVRRGVLAG